ncbi:hypothetical protein GHT06_013083 [Daphnia sinensis]|uniref:PHD-type domain-containing protein n=1 Tax=Daphnia sinensis TaxID=1820382 RepID=A0AAD5LH08_9CRUS|nr:hypothetical protein GHT06_013083 [Daphnia sinensis]
MSGNDVLNTQTPLTLSYRSPDALRVPKTKADTSEEPTLDIIGETVDILDHISITNAASIAVERAESLAAKNLLSKQKQPAWRTMSATKRVAAASKSELAGVEENQLEDMEPSQISKPPVPSIVSPGIPNVLFDKANRFKMKKRTTAEYDSGLCNIPLCKMVNQDTIGCEGCDRWFHYKCGKIKQVDYPENVPCFCSICISKKKGTSMSISKLITNSEAFMQNNISRILQL